MGDRQAETRVHPRGVKDMNRETDSVGTGGRGMEGEKGGVRDDSGRDSTGGR